MVCKICNSENSEASKFCATCGAKLEEAPVATAPMFCSGCGGALEANTKFCAVCGTPVSGAPVAAAEPVPVMAAAPASAPAPVNAPAPVPTPVNDSAPVGFGGAVAAQTAEPAAFGAGATAVQPDFGGASNGAPFELPDFDANNAASTVVAKPVKKGGKKALKIVLISLGALIVVAAVVVGLFFREFFHPIFMGNQGYAAKVERSRLNVVAESEALDNVTKNSEIFVDSVVKGMQQSNGYGGSYNDISASYGSGDLESIIKTYYDSFMEVYGVNAVTVEFDADIDLNEEAYSALDLDDDEVREIIDYINDLDIKMTCATSEDAFGALVEAKDGDGFTVNAKGVVYSDGNVALMFPFGSDKCIKMKVDAATGTVTESEEIDIDIDPAEVERLINGLLDIYIKHYEKSETTIENGDISIGGTTENATLKASGRLITVNISSATIGEMLSEMITYIAEDQYFTNKVIEMAEEGGVELSAVDYRNELMDVADEIKYEVPFSVTVKTLVNFNGNVLGGAYNVTVPNEGSYGIKYIANGNDCGFALTGMGMELLNVTVNKTSDTDGLIRLESGAVSMAMMNGSYSNMPSATGINIKYAGVKNEKYFNSEVPVGTYDIYLAGTAASGPENSPYRIHAEDKVDGSTYSHSIKAEMSEYGSIAFTLSSTAYNDKDLLTIPADAYDCGDVNNITEEQAIAAGEYLLEMINELKATCDNSNSDMAALIAEGLAEMAESLEESLTPMADYYDIQDLADEAYDLMYEIMDKYEEGEKYISDDLVEVMSDLYDDLDEMYDELYYAYDMTLDEFEDYRRTFESYKTGWNELRIDVDKQIEAGKTAATAPGTTNRALVGTWYFYECDMYGFEYSADELDIECYIDLFADGSMLMDYDGEYIIGTWHVANGKVVLTEIIDYAEYVDELTIDGNILILEDDGLILKFRK